MDAASGSHAIRAARYPYPFHRTVLRGAALDAPKKRQMDNFHSVTCNRLAQPNNPTRRRIATMPEDTSSILLISEPPLQVLPSLVVALGYNNPTPAMLLQRVHYRLVIAARSPQPMGRVKDGRQWVYASRAQWLDQFPWIDERTFRRYRQLLCDKGVLLYEEEANDAAPGGSRCWYSIDYDALNNLLDSHSE